MATSENKSISQIVEERKEAKLLKQRIQQNARKETEKQRRQQDQVLHSQKQDLMSRKAIERTQQLIQKWGLAPIIQEVSDYIGKDVRVIPVRVANMKYPSSTFTSLTNASPTEIDQVTQYLSKDNPGFSILIYSGDYPRASHQEVSGKCIRFVELDGNSLLIVPGARWAIEACPVVDNKELVRQACIGLFERDMENWRIAAPPESYAL